MITRRDWLFIIIANAVSLAIALPAACFHWGWVAASAAVTAELLLLGWFCSRHPEPIFIRLFVFGLVAGWVELLNDTWLVAARKVLVYDPGGPFVLDTPLYMPFTWALIFVTTGAIALWLWEKLGPLLSIPVMMLFSALYIPAFEAIAAAARWWFYRDVRMFMSLAPWFVILSEALLAAPLPWMSNRMRSAGWGIVIILGVVEGLLIWGATALWLNIVG